ncbi:MAG: RNA-binding S4 domain-containing protein [Actinobacteria bacterium]|nr:RNA-binding S4 domain-containing protein [Actinomycetota bacterium]
MSSEGDIRVVVLNPGTTLGQALKYVGLVMTGGEGKARIAGGEVRVNGAVESHRGRRLVNGDEVALGETSFRVSVWNREDTSRSPG